MQGMWETRHRNQKRRQIIVCALLGMWCKAFYTKQDLNISDGILHNESSEKMVVLFNPINCNLFYFSNLKPIANIPMYQFTANS